MTRQVLYNARLLDPETGLDAVGGVVVEDGVFADVGEHVTIESVKGADGHDCAGKALAPGLIDMRVTTGEPGSEHRETLASASRAAVGGGITSVVVMPDTEPVIDTPALIEYIRRTGEAQNVLNRVYPSGALTVGLEGDRMSELALMSKAGAILFSNGDKPLRSTNLVRRSLQYAKGVGARVMLRPDDAELSTGSMNASAFAARLGLRGLPVQAEWIGLQRDLTLAEMTQCPIIIDQVTTGRSFDFIADARKRALDITVTAAAHSLYFNELDIGDGTRDPDKAYLTYCKVNPPFRSESDRLSLIEALRSGALDIIVSAHNPQPPEDKRLPFDEASFGAAGLETLLSALTTLADEPEYELDLLSVLKAVTLNPAEVLGLPQGRLKKDAPADIMIFDPRTPWKCEREKLRSRSGNSPFDGRLLTGRVLKTMIAGKWVFDRARDETS